MRINEFAKKLNVSARTVRFYEEKGLLSPAKEPGNSYRSFTEKDVWRLQTILSLREAGMPLAEIRQALAKLDENNHEELSYYLELQRSVLVSQWLDIKQKIETTEQMIGLLKTNPRLPLDDIYELVDNSRKIKRQRSNWQDRWNYDLLAATHDEQTSKHAGHYADYDTALDFIVRWVSPKPGEHGLDIGTGTGNLAGRLMMRGAVMSAVDQSKEMLRLCAQKYPSIETKLGNFLAIPYLDGQFDFIVSSFAFRHLAEQQQVLALSELRRVSKPHARICLADLMQAENEMPDASHPYPRLSGIESWFEQNGYLAKPHQVNRRLHIVCAVPVIK